MRELVLPLVCHALTWMKERCSYLVPCYLQQAEELALRSSEQESWPYPSPTVELDLEVGLQVSQPPGYELKKTILPNLL